MSLNPQVIKDSMGVYWVKWSPDPSASGYAIVTPTGASRTFNPAASKSKLGNKLVEPVTASVQPLRVSALGPAETATYPPALPPPPLSRSPWPHGGISWWGPGADLPPGSNRYDIGITANWHAEGGHVNQADLAVLYGSGARCSVATDGRWYGMTPQELQANHWAALDAHGQPVVEQAFQGMIANIGDAAYALKWAKNIEAWLVKYHYDGVQIDDVDGSLHELTSTAIPIWPDDQAWRAANVKFHETAAGYLRAQGFYVVANCSGDDAFKLSIAPLVDAVMIEYYQPSKQGTARKILQAGCDAIGLVKDGSSTPDAARQSIEAIGDPRGVTMVAISGSQDPWGPWAA